MKRAFCLILAVIVLLPARAVALELSANSAILVDAHSGRVLYSHNADEQRLIASTTKIMTAFLALQMADTTDKVTIKKSHTLVEGSRVYFKEGDVLTVGELLIGVLLQSGNDAALALADHCGGSGGISAFVDAMNNMARQLGMTNSSFANPHGLNDDNNYSTAADMAKLACAAMSNPSFAAVTSQKTGTVGEITVKNHNKMLWNYEGANGIKTGYTQKAGRCLVSSAERGGQLLVVVTLDAPSDWNDHTVLLDYGFNNFPERRLSTADAFVCELPVISGIVAAVNVRVRDTLSHALTSEELRTVRVQVELPRFIWAPVESGQTVGMIKYTMGDKLIAESELYADAQAPERTPAKKSVWKRFMELFE